MNQNKLDKYSFLWSEVRLLIAAVALFIGGVPPVYVILRLPALYGIITPLLTLCWIISGLASGYLLYRWKRSGQKLFGSQTRNDSIAFWISIISGLNLGLTGLIRVNLGMTLLSGYLVFIIVALIYLATAV